VALQKTPNSLLNPTRFMRDPEGVAGNLPDNGASICDGDLALCSRRCRRSEFSLLRTAVS